MLESCHVIVYCGLDMCKAFLKCCYVQLVEMTCLTGSCPDHQAINIEWISELKILHLSPKYTRAWISITLFFFQFVVNIIPQGTISLLWSLSQQELLKCEQAVLNIAIHRV
jgi:hypothetical protein